jgi:hypothetical protein
MFRCRRGCATWYFFLRWHLSLAKMIFGANPFADADSGDEGSSEATSSIG